jgi:hypothetical protein
MRYALAVVALSALLSLSWGMERESVDPPKTERDVLASAERSSVTLNQLRARIHSADPSVRAATVG